MKNIFEMMECLPMRRVLVAAAAFFVLFGMALRFYRINQNDFVFYDEGYYLNFMRPFGEVLGRHLLPDAGEIGKAVWTFIRICLGTGKALWFLVVDSRVFWGGLKTWYFSRIVAAVFGILTLFLIYPFARRFYQSEKVALISVAILAVLPSQVFYSRVGLQETLSAFLVLSGFYLYLFPREFGRRTFFSGLVFGAAFFSNYRLIILPVLILVAELWQAFSHREWFNVRKYLWCCLMYFCCIFLIGGIDDGRNTRTVFAWMFHQVEMAEQRFDPVNLLSYPYYLFRLENLFLGIIFFMGNMYLCWRRQWRTLLPFVLATTQMAIFSFAGEKGARYLAAVMPFIVLSTACVLVHLWQDDLFRKLRPILAGIILIMFLGMTVRSVAMAGIRSDYQRATADILAMNPRAKLLSTQPYVQSLFVANAKNVQDCPHSFAGLVNSYAEGFQYLVVDPQAYISWTKDGVRFLPDLDGYLGFMVKAIRPQRVYRNFSDTMLERFVFEHSENLRRSIQFLKRNSENHYGVIFVYDLSQAIPQMMRILSETRGGLHGAR